MVLPAWEIRFCLPCRQPRRLCLLVLRTRAMNVTTAARRCGQRRKRMVTFTINDDDNITVYPGAEEAARAGDPTATSFDSPTTLAKVSAEWPLSRFAEVWNSMPGNTKLKKFQDRKKAVARIWQ